MAAAVEVLLELCQLAVEAPQLLVDVVVRLARKLQLLVGSLEDPLILLQQ